MTNKNAAASPSNESESAADNPVFVLSAGEASGDFLGAQCAAVIRARYPHATIYGIGGEHMAEQGVELVASYRSLAVMGYLQVFAVLPAILKVRAALLKRIKAQPPTLFIGIDAPDFNLAIAKRVRAAGGRSVQYVAPSVWMWRRYRLARIFESVNMLWCLLPFEPSFFSQAKIPARFVGHPIAAHPAPSADARARARALLGIGESEQAIALFPGSRDIELAEHLPLFAKTQAKLKAPHRRFIAAVHHPSVEARVRKALPNVIIANISDVLAAADVAIVKSGTITLQVAMAQVPLVMVYRAEQVAYWLVRARRMYRPFFSLPNIIANRFIIPELIQTNATPAAIAAETQRLLENTPARTAMQTAFTQMRESLTTNTTTIEEALDAVLNP